MGQLVVLANLDDQTANNTRITRRSNFAELYRDVPDKTLLDFFPQINASNKWERDGDFITTAHSELQSLNKLESSRERDCSSREFAVVLIR